MDGGGRIGGSLAGAFSGSPAARPLFGAPNPGSANHSFVLRPRFAKYSLKGFMLRMAKARGTSLSLAALMLTLALGYGAVRGGQYQSFVALYGSIPDLIARNAGFDIEAVTIAGQRELGEKDILAAAGINPRLSLVFLDVSQVRKNLMALPRIKNAKVLKLYPGRLMIEIEERQPFALWQRDGQVSLVSSDGVSIGLMDGEAQSTLPLIVGEGANDHLQDYLALLDAAGDMRPRIRAGVLVSGRRWNLKMASGADVKLPEKDAVRAMALFARLEKEQHLLDRDIISFDLRQPGRLVARLSEDVAASRAEALAAKKPNRGGPV